MTQVFGNQGRRRRSEDALLAKSAIPFIAGLCLTACSSLSGGDEPTLDERLEAQEQALQSHVEHADIHSGHSIESPAELKSAIEGVVRDFNKVAKALGETEIDTTDAETPDEDSSDNKIVPPTGYTSAGANLQGGEPFDTGAITIPFFQGPAGLHLVSYSDAANLQAGWDYYRRTYPDILGALDVRVEYITLADGSPFLRLKAGPLPNAQLAAPYCARLKARGAFCAIVPFTGNPIDTFIITP